MSESFSFDVKTEICGIRTKMNCCRFSLFYGMLYGIMDISREEISFESDNPAVAVQLNRLLKEFCRIKGENPLQSLRDYETAVKTLADYPSLFEGDPLSDSVMKCEFCGWAFAKGVFLTCGTVTRPETSYHMEFLFRGEARAKAFAEYLNILGLPPKLIKRRGGYYGVYYKDSETVVDILGHFGANNAAFELLDVIIYKDLRNNANRVANCETANIGKTIAASNQQMRAIERILESDAAEDLPDELKQTLDLRAAFPDASLAELASRHQPPITRSGVNHRLKRLIDFADKL